MSIPENPELTIQILESTVEELQARCAELEKDISRIIKAGEETCAQKERVIAEWAELTNHLKDKCARQAEMLKEAKDFATEIEGDFSHSEYCKYDDSWEDEVEENRNVDECWKCAMAVWLADLEKGPQ